MKKKVAYYLLKRIRTYKQFSTKFCSMFAIGHVLALLMNKDYQKVEVNPWKIVRLVFLQQGYKKIFNRAKSIEEVVETLKVTGLWVKGNDKKFKIFPGPLLQIKFNKTNQYIGRAPLIGITRTMHAMVIIAIYPENPTEYVVIDSASRKGYSHVHQSNFQQFYIIPNYTVQP